MSLKSFVLKLMVLLIGSASIGCNDPKKTSEAVVEKPPVERDLDDIKKSGKLKALTVYSGTSYFLFEGKPMGYEYELLQRFAEYLGVELEMVVVENLNELIDKLNQGEGDILAHGLAITEDRKQAVTFSNHLYLTKQVLVQKKPDDWRTMHWRKLQNSLIEDAIELLRDTVSVREGSSYNERIANLSEELGGTIYVNELSGQMATDEIIKLVAEGEVKYTIADNNIAKIMAASHPILDIGVPVSFSQRIAWATRQNSPELLRATNHWLEEMKEDVDYYVIYNKYFKNTKAFRRRAKSDFYSLNTGEISPFDSLIRKHAKTVGWDWRLLASLIYQESRFDPDNSSWADAEGLMQLMPKTAEELGVRDRRNPNQSLRGGTEYLKQLWDDFEQVTDSVQRVKFTMASYNAGPYHIKDAQNLAGTKGMDTQVWDDQVEDMVLALSHSENYENPVVHHGYVRGVEPYNYVNQIFERYGHYIQFIEE